MNLMKTSLNKTRSKALYWVSVFVAILVISNPTTGYAQKNICDSAAVIAATEIGVPVGVLRAITRTETGRGPSHDPWPWTVNMQGKGKWFDTEDAARKYVFSHFKAGARSFDVGCFQINFKWHGDAFRSIDEMFDPLINARYAAEFLAKLYQETGNWPDAAGAYHSRTPKYAKRYKARYEKIRAQDQSTTLEATPAPIQNGRRNSYPLLHRKGTVNGYGSLVPLSTNGSNALIEGS